MVGENLDTIRSRIESSCRKCGRNPDDITLVAVSKTFGVEKIAEAISAGQRDFGENYVQELDEKHSAVGRDDVRWHFIGHLQSNKVKYVAPYIHLIHSVDSAGLIEEIDRRAEKAGRVVDYLVEVHTTDEATKFGAKPAEVADLVLKGSGMKHSRVIGLMTMGPFSDDPGDSRPSFKLVAELRREIECRKIPGVRLNHLSMGMTHDFEVAIEEGATLLRIGTAIFGKRQTV
ncbi:MAG TPA: YggS family pyridoxal phosphate-dependent enzyme [Bacteroidota bacterium]|nr:YggS family pyridoxal phosphate-dependent enzyme [Bacteroidota bacterium]